MYILTFDISVIGLSGGPRRVHGLGAMLAKDTLVDDLAVRLVHRRVAALARELRKVVHFGHPVTSGPNRSVICPAAGDVLRTR